MRRALPLAFLLLASCTKPGQTTAGGHPVTESEQLLFLPPVPLATGEVLDDEDSGELHRVTNVEVVVTTDDGAQLRIPLEHRHGAWWAP